MNASRIAALLVLAFLFGGSSAEVAVQTSRALARARADRKVGSAGDLVALEVRDEGGPIARPRFVAPLGHPVQLTLRDPMEPDRVRLQLRVEATREPTGDVSLEYALEIPARDVTALGRVTVTPGVEHTLALGGGRVEATLLTLPVPSAAFDAYLEAERLRHAPPDPT
ncbi:MAG TPA: hypothetical protein VFF02_07415 [Anaeromyxobacteraceae bacterium]|nr:hypothetical protein [Anaeromyxobacteraceae bacterium]